MDEIQTNVFHLANGDTVGSILYRTSRGIVTEVQFQVRPEHTISFNMPVGDGPRLWPVRSSGSFQTPQEAFAWALKQVCGFIAREHYQVISVDNLDSRIAVSVADQQLEIAALGLSWPVTLDGVA